MAELFLQLLYCIFGCLCNIFRIVAVVVLGGALLASKLFALGAEVFYFLEMVWAKDRLELTLDSLHGFGKGFLGVLDILLL